jgi:hypothetical protein
MAKYVVNSRLSFARNFILTENNRSRSSPLLQAATRYQQVVRNLGEFNNLTQQMINFIFVELWKKHTNESHLTNV